MHFPLNVILRSASDVNANYSSYNGGGSGALMAKPVPRFIKFDNQRGSTVLHDEDDDGRG